MAVALLFGVGLAASAAGVVALVVVHRFHQTPEYAWRQKVFAHSATLAELKRRLEVGAPQSPERVVEREKQAAMESARRTIPLSRVMDQPGIGPGALSLLKQSGVNDVPTILRAHLERINGIGPQKAATLELAARVLIADCDAAFVERRSREGEAFAVNAVRVRLEAQGRWDRYAAELESVHSALNAHRTAEKLASQIDLWRYWREHPVEGLDRHRMESPFATPGRHGPRSNPQEHETRKPLSEGASNPQVTASFRLAWATEFGMFLVHQGGKGRNERKRRLQNALKRMFSGVAGAVTLCEDFDPIAGRRNVEQAAGDSLDRAVTVEINRHLTPKLRPADWFASIMERRMSPSTDFDQLIEFVLGPADFRSEDEAKLANWLERRCRRTDAGGDRVNPTATAGGDFGGSEERVIPSKTAAPSPSSPPVPTGRKERELKARSGGSAYKTKIDSRRDELPLSGDLLQELLNNPSTLAQPTAPKRTIQSDRLEAFTRFGVMVALADGRAAQIELRVVRRFLTEIFGQDPELVRRFDPLIESCTVSKPHEATTLGDAMRLASSPEELNRLYRWAVEITDASSGRNDREAGLLARIATAWAIVAESAPQSGLRNEPYKSKALPEPVEATPPSEASPHDPKSELEIPRDAIVTVELVRRRFRMAIDRLDANRLDELGAEFAKLASVKRERLRQAAETLMLPFSASLEEPQAERITTDIRHNPDLDDVFGA